MGSGLYALKGPFVRSPPKLAWRFLRPARVFFVTRLSTNPSLTVIKRTLGDLENTTIATKFDVTCLSFNAVTATVS